MNKETEELLADYRKKKNVIKKRLNEFKQVLQETDEKLFEELCFCLCTPQSKARLCDNVVKKLSSKKLLLKASQELIAKNLHGVRFHNTKASYIVFARNFFTEKEKLNLKKCLASMNPFRLRHWLVQNIKGLGFKEATHFLRNIGLGKNMLIIDRHVLKNLKKLKVIDEIPKNLSEKNYLVIEESARKFSSSLNISLEELDLLLWSKETGEVFK